MSVDGMAARARRLAELEAAQATREQQARVEWQALVERARALGQPVPDALAGRLSSVLSAQADALDVREHALDRFESGLSDWRTGLERLESEDLALGRLRDRLRQTLADEIGELSPAELKRVVARAFGERRHTGPLAPAAPSGPSAGVEQEALLLGQLLGDAQMEALADSFEGPLDTITHPPPAKAGTRTVEAARIDDHEGSDDPFGPFVERSPSAEEALTTLPGAAPADIGALLDEAPRAVRRPRSLMREPQYDAQADDVELEIDVDDGDLEPGEETLARWLGTTREPILADTSTAEALDAAIDPLDEDDSLLEWEAAGLGNQVAMLVERRRPASARTSIMDLVEDPFDAFDDFDDSLDAPFGFVENVTGQGPALADADWSIDDSPSMPEDTPSADGTAPAGITGSEFEVLQLDDPFADDSTVPRTEEPASGSTVSGATRLDPADTGEIDGVDMGEAFATIGRPLGADSMEAEQAAPIEIGDGFEQALGEAFARSGPDTQGLAGLDDFDGFDDLDEPGADGDLFVFEAEPVDAPAVDPFDSAFEAELEAAFNAGEAPEPGPAAAPDRRTGPPMVVSDRPTARPWSPTEVEDGPQDASLLPAPSDPGADGWGPRALDDTPDPSSGAGASESVAADDDAPDHIATDFGAALIDPAFEPGGNPFEIPQLTQPAAAPMTLSGSTNPDSDAAAPAGSRIDAALARVEAIRRDEDGAAAGGENADAFTDAVPADDGIGDAHLTGLDWPAPRALHAFPDGSMDDHARAPLAGPTADAARAPRLGERPSDAHGSLDPEAGDSSAADDEAFDEELIGSPGSAGGPDPSRHSDHDASVDAAEAAVYARENEAAQASVETLTPGAPSWADAAGSRPQPVASAEEPGDDLFTFAAVDPPDAAAASAGRGRARHTLEGHPAPSRGPTGTAAYGAVDPDPARRTAPAAEASGSPFDPLAFGRASSAAELSVDPWRSSPVAPSASLADALQAARHDDGEDSIDAVLDGVHRPDERDEERRVTDRFAALAGDPGDDPWVSLDIPQGGVSDALPDLMRRRRQGRPAPAPARALPAAGARAAAPAEPPEESAPRAALGVRVGLEAGDRFFTGFSRDISVDGMFIHTQHALKVGEAVEVFFELPGGRSINARGRIRRLRRGDGGRAAGLGLRFENLTREARVHIGRYVSRTLTGKIPLP